MPFVNNYKYCIRVIVELTILFSVLAAVFMVKKFWPPFERGMQCNDLSLSFPSKESETISDTVLLFYGVAIPLNVMFLVEFLRIRREPVGKDLRICGTKFSSWLWSVYSSVGVFLFGCAASQLFTSVAKHTLGVLRPDFIDVCKPDWSKTNCSIDKLSFIYPIPCTTDDLETLKDAKLSFPSGHASFSTFTMVFLVLYLQARLRFPGYRLIRPLMQLSCLLIDFFTCLSRISDYKHHWSDVLGGAALGALIALLVVFFVSNLFIPTKRPPSIKDSAMMLEECRQNSHDHHNLSHAP